MDSVDDIAIQKHTLSGFEEHLNSYITKLEAVENRLDLQSYVSNAFHSFTETFIALGDQTQEDASNAQDIFLVHYVLAEDFKTVMLLHRDVFLELNKASICKQEITMSDSQIIKHYSESKAVLVQKLEAFKTLISSDKNNPSDDKKQLKQIALKISHQTNPWDIYKTQYETILTQVNTIDEQKVLAYASIAIFNNLKSVVVDLTNKHKAIVGKISDNIKHISKNTEAQKDYNELLVYAEEQLAQQSIVENKHDSFSETVNHQINQLEKIDIPVGSIDGFLSVRDIDLRKRTQKWFDYQILPEFMDLIGLETN